MPEMSVRMLEWQRSLDLPRDKAANQPVPNEAGNQRRRAKRRGGREATSGRSRIGEVRPCQQVCRDCLDQVLSCRHGQRSLYRCWRWQWISRCRSRCSRMGGWLLRSICQMVAKVAQHALGGLEAELLADLGIGPDRWSSAYRFHDECVAQGGGPDVIGHRHACIQAGPFQP